jgi:ribosomal protein S18 acetylase RimI-like enzyme
VRNIKVVRASKRDSGQLLRFFRHYKDKTLSQNRVECYLSHNFTIVAKDENKIVGILQWHIKEDPNTGTVEFEEMFVLEEYRGKGVGSALIEYAIGSVKAYFANLKIRPRKIFLFVAKKNKIARKLYQKYGFRPLADLGRLFSDTETELFYCLDLH